jgi:perosamine synthetase
MSNLQAAVGVAQLECLEQHLARKHEIGSYYNTALADLRDVQLPRASVDLSDNCYWVYGMVLERSHPLDRDTAMRRLAEKGIGTRPFFWPMHEQPVLKEMGYFPNEKLPVAEHIGRRGFYIPSGLSLDGHQLKQVGQTVRSVLE